MNYNKISKNNLLSKKNCLNNKFKNYIKKKNKKFNKLKMISMRRIKNINQKIKLINKNKKNK